MREVQRSFADELERVQVGYCDQQGANKQKEPRRKGGAKQTDLQ
jgi:hypothetical protein